MKLGNLSYFIQLRIERNVGFSSIILSLCRDEIGYDVTASVLRENDDDWVKEYVVLEASVC